MITFLLSIEFIVWFIPLAIIGMIVFLEQEKQGITTFILSLAVGLLIWRNGNDILSWVQNNIGETILFTLGYVGAGIVWSFVRWNEKVKMVFRRFLDIKTKFIKNNGELTEKNRADYIHKIDKDFRDSRGSKMYFSPTITDEELIKKITPLGLEHKSLIVSWISYWPLSVIGTLLNNPFRRFFEWVYDSLSGLYDKIAENRAKEILR